MNDYLRNKKSSKDDKDYLEFICILIRILDVLNYAQEKCFFTHFDLHLSNIILRKSDSFNNYLCSYHIDYSVFLSTSEFNKMVPIFIDFEYSTAIRSSIICSNKKTFPQFGYIGIFLSGVDVLRLLFCLKRETQTMSSHQT